MSRYTKTQVTQLSANEQAAIDNINKNFDDIQSAIQDTVSRGGNTPTHMTHDLDMNGKRIINLPAPKTDTDPVRRQDVVGDIALVQNLVNATTNAAAQTLKAAAEVQEIIQDENVGLVADDLGLGENSKIKQVAENKSNINIVASLEDDIATVVDLKDDIPVVVQAAEDIDKVEDIAEDITAVANNTSNITAVAENEENINAVNANKTNINAAVSNATNINAVAGNQTNINNVANNANNINAVAGNTTNINAVNANKTNIDAVAGDKTNIDTVAGIANDVSTVANNSSDVSNVATNMSDVNDCATNIAAIQAAPSAASSAAASAQQAAISAAGAKFKLFHHDWFDYQLNDLAWLRADTFSWQDGTVYSDAYDHLVADWNGGTWTTETVAGITIGYMQTEDGHKICSEQQESTVLAIYNATGVAWYYILDTTNQRFKLPRENPAREELIQVVRAKGNGMTLGLTNGTTNVGLAGVYGGSRNELGGKTDAYGKSVGTGAQGDDGNTKNNWLVGVTTDPTNSGIISDMKDSTSAYKGKKYLYFYVGQFSQSATEQTAGLNSELFNSKLDLDGNNATASTINTLINKANSTTKQTIVGWGKPDYSSGIDISGYASSNNQFVAPKDGILSLFINSYNTNGVYIDNTLISRCNTGDSAGRMALTVPISKGQTFYGIGMTTASNFTPQFYPAKGE